MIKKISQFLMALLVIFTLMSCNDSIKGRVGLKCIYMGYACGECEAKYKIKEIINKESALPEGIKESELKAIFKSSNHERDIDNIVKDCAICYDYYFWGSLVKSSIKDYYTITVDSVSVLINSDRCCEKNN